jgi:hypothetical protein
MRGGGCLSGLHQFLILLLFAANGGGCAAAALSAAGAVGGVAYTDRGAEGEIKGDLDQVNLRASQTLKNMGIQITGNEMKGSGKEQSISGRSGSTEVRVTMTRAAAGTTHIEVIAREGTLKWNKDYAKDILSRIVRQG